MSRRVDRASRPTLLYIGGLGRSGSTLLERLLGQLDGVVSLGEVQSLWRHRLAVGRLCGCGELLSRCPFWTALPAAATDPGRALTLQRRVERTRHLPLLLAPGLFPAFASRLNRYRALLEGVYDAVEAHTGATVLVDSSKSPANAFVLRRLRGFELRVVHMVRDSRGVAYSWQKRMSMEPGPDAPLMARESSLRVGLLWSTYNVLFAGLRLLGVPVLRLRYEDLVGDPRAQLAQVVTFAGAAHVEPLDFVTDTSARLDRVGHTVAGNPMRFDRGIIRIQRDEQWRSALPPAQRLLVSLLTLPGLLRYGYLGASGSEKPNR